MTKGVRVPMKCLSSAVVILSACLIVSVFKPGPCSSLAWAEPRDFDSREIKYSVIDQTLPTGIQMAQASVDDDSAAEDEEEVVEIADPIYYWNKGMYHFNDKFYFWLLKPVARGYRWAVPELVRTGVSNFFYNLRFPIRFVSCLLQAKGGAAVGELGRFVVNTTAGVAGLRNVAKAHPKLNPSEEDLGQTFGRWGIGSGFYIVWPFLGPSTLRESVGWLGDLFLDPVTYVEPTEASAGIMAYEALNKTSFRIGDYEALKEAAIDPYISIRDAYVQHRKKKVEE
jgi:phospholipid-binding lipoprotein MlaA